MADWIEDDWDSSSPVGSPSSSLPQSIREVLESVRAECSTGKLGAYCIAKPTAIMEASTANEDKLKSHDELTVEVVDTKEMIAKPYGQTLVNSDMSQESSLPEHVASQSILGSATKEILKDLTEPIQSNCDSHNVDTISPRLNVEKERDHKNGVKEANSTQSQDDFGKGLEPLSVIGGRISRNLIPEDLLGAKKTNYAMVRGIQTDYRKTKVARWIKIDSQNYKANPNNVPLGTQYCQINPEYESPPAVHINEIKSTGALGLGMRIENHHEIMIQDGLKREASTDHKTAAKNDVSAAQCVTNKVDLYKKTAHENHLIHAAKSGLQGTQCIDLTGPESPAINETTLKKLKEDESSLTGLDEMWAAENSTMVEKNTQNPAQIIKECFPIKKQVRQSLETIDLNSDDDEEPKRVYVNPGCVELSDDSQSVECKPEEVINQPNELGTSAKLEEDDTNDMDEILADDWIIDYKPDIVDVHTIQNIKPQKRCSSDDSENSVRGQSSEGLPTHGLPRASQRENKQQSESKAHDFKYNSTYQDDEHMEWAYGKSNENSVLNECEIEEMDIADDDVGSDDENQIQKIFQREQTINDDILHNKLKEKFMNMYSLKEMTPRMKEEYCEYKPVDEEIEDFAIACDESPTHGVKKIKMEIFNDYCNEQVVNKNAIYRDSNSGEGRKNSVTVWRQELLSSDFNLIYGSLRAILMRNISKDERHRLIQTVIATMSEIEEVTTGGGKPTRQSVRCETPEPSPEIDRLEEGEKEPEKESDSDKNEETRREPTPLGLPVYDEEIRSEWAVYNKQTLRSREIGLNSRRIKELMRVCSDGTLECLICKKRGLPRGRVCRACSAMVYRIERIYTIGAPLPTCLHANYSGGARCKSCRFRQFSFLSMSETATRVRQVNTKQCPICKEPSYYTRGWKCIKCYHFFLKLLRTKGPMPTCKHRGEFPFACQGCRCYNLQGEWANYEMYREYPLPLVKK